MNTSSRLNFPLWLITAGLATILPAAILLLSAQTNLAGSASWLSSPLSNDWNSPDNWTKGGPPNGPFDTATFSSSSITGVSLSDLTEVNAIVFNVGASAFTITVYSPLQLTISGVGIGNNSATAQNFVIFGYAVIQFLNNSTVNNGSFINNSGAGGGGSTQFFDTSNAGNGSFTNNASEVGTASGFTLFHNNSTAASGTFTNSGAAVINANGGSTGFHEISTAGSGTFTNNGGTVSGANAGVTYFWDNSTGGNATFINNGSVVGAATGFTYFADSSNAGNGTFTNNGGTINGAGGGSTNFVGTSSADNGTFIDNGGAIAGAGSGSTLFFNTSTAGNSTLIANGGAGEGGSVLFSDDSTGATARVIVVDNGYLDISGHQSDVTIGSIEGTGNVVLGVNNLRVGTNGVSTSFSGRISNSGEASSLAKIGSGTLRFEARSGNDYLEDSVGLILVSGSIINLNFTGVPDVIGSLVVNSVLQIQGVYGGPASGAPNQIPEFGGTGTVEVTRGPAPTATATATPTPTATLPPPPPPPPTPTSTPAPAVTTNPATNVATFSATLNGSVNPRGSTTTVFFQYGTTTSYGSTTASQTKTGNTSQSVSANIPGLSAGTTYHFRIVAPQRRWHGLRYGPNLYHARRNWATCGYHEPGDKRG